MGKILLFAIILIIASLALIRPWVGVVSYYLLAILGPQYIWWWNFEGLRVSLIVALSSIGGVGLHVLMENYYDYKFLLNKQNYLLAFLWFSITCSYLFGPYVGYFSSSGLSPSEIFSITNTIFIFYFIATLEMNEIRKLRYLMMVFSLSTIYLIYWANNQYFSQNWFQFNWGRLMGPFSLDGGSIYRDENTFAMFFVTGLPFIFYLGLTVVKKWLRFLLWIIIPLGWHAIFLTGSRGGLVGVVVTIICYFFLSHRRRLVLPLLLLFYLFFQWQSGSVMLQRSHQIVDIEGERSADDRLTAWHGGIRMIVDNPITGVGLGSFVTALPDYIESRHMVAHNTFIQFAAESGVGAGIAYIGVIFLFFLHSRKIRQYCADNATEKETSDIIHYNDACTVSFSGLVVCSTFLSLTTYEIFFVLLLFNNTLYQICLKKHHVLD